MHMRHELQTYETRGSQDPYIHESHAFQIYGSQSVSATNFIHMSHELEIYEIRESRAPYTYKSREFQIYGSQKVYETHNPHIYKSRTSYI